MNTAARAIIRDLTDRHAASESCVGYRVQCSHDDYALVFAVGNVGMTIPIVRDVLADWQPDWNYCKK